MSMLPEDDGEDKMTTMKKQTLDQRIDAIKPGGSIELSRSNGTTVTAERSGDGKTLRFVRSSGDTSTVFRTTSFNGWNTAKVG